MGREIRRVPPNWEHPKSHNGEYIGMFDQTYEDAVKEWKEGYAAWEAGTHEHFASANRDEPCEFWESEDDPPERGYYRPAFTEDPTWWQMYQTVSEGTPVTPPFATAEELIDYLCTYGEFGYQKYGYGDIPSREAATGFVKSGSAPSFLVTNNPGQPVKIYSGVEAFEPHRTQE